MARRVVRARVEAELRRPWLRCADAGEDDWHSRAERDDQLNRLRQTRDLRGPRELQYFSEQPTSAIVEHFKNTSARPAYRDSLAGELGSRAVKGDPEALEAARAVPGLAGHPDYEWYWDDFYENEDDDYHEGSRRTAAPRVRPVGFNDKQTTCGLCGREELKGTVILGYDGDDGGEFGRFGTGCAGKVMSEVNGTPARITRSDAVKWEAFRRETVLHHLDRARKAWQAGDVPGAQWEIADMRRNRNAFPHMDDELAAIAEIDASGRYRSIGRNLEPGEREEHYRRRVEEGLDEYETSLAPPQTGRRKRAASVKLYRGLRVNLPPELVAEMRSKLADPTTAAEFGRELELGPRVLDHLSTTPWQMAVEGGHAPRTGLGPNWHPDPGVAHNAAYGYYDVAQQGTPWADGQRADWPMLMTVEADGGEADPRTDALAGEVHLPEGAKVRVTSLLLQPEFKDGKLSGRELLWRPDWQHLTESHGISTGGPQEYTAGRLAGIRFEVNPALGLDDDQLGERGSVGNWAYAIDDEPSEDASGRPLGAGEPVAELCWDPDTGEVNWVQTRRNRRRQGIGRGLFNWVRENHQPDLRHSDDLSDDGRAFAEAVAAVRTARAALRACGGRR